MKIGNFIHKKYLEFLDYCFIDQENNNYNKLDIWFPDPQ